jgi:cyclopropane-fatty-acyl-phospholipid synthase
MATLTTLDSSATPRLPALSPRRTLETLLSSADVRLDGRRPWDIAVHDSRLARRILMHGSLGAGESYMDGWWDCERLDEMFTRVLTANLDRRFGRVHELLSSLAACLRNAQSSRRAFQVGEQHYDVGDDLFAAMLDRRMIYSCGYWKKATDLEAAQQDKLDLVCRKLVLRPGMRVLDIGCGWGGAAQFAAEHYRVNVTGVTVSSNQALAMQTRCHGLPVTAVLADYRDLTGKFDRIYSLGMFEHVGARNYGAFFSKVRELLAPDGLFLLHTIGSNWSSNTTDPWIEKYIFPNSVIPSMAQIAKQLEHRWVVEDWHSFGVDYDHTLMAWLDRFESNWPAIGSRYSERFRRMWRYYLTVSAASFRVRRNQLWQILLSPHGLPGGYPEVR